jgi:glycosyltransferase involved in cell wall biosynthesis
MAKCTVDVLLPVFNGASTIAQAIQSLQHQTVTGIRIVVIDDGSTDQTPQILASIAEQDSRIEVITKSNDGIVDALNAGLARCQGEFVARQDADDISHPSRFSLQIAHLQSDPECVAVSGAFTHIDEQGRASDVVYSFPQPELADPRWAPSREPYLMHPFLMARRKDLQAVGGYRYVYHSEDVDLYWRLLERGKLHNLNAVLGSYRMHAKSISSESTLNGRISALSSQLAGLSARRRRESRTDIDFPKEAISEYRRAQTLSKIYEIAVRQLDDDESRYLRIAVAAKLLELASYRPYQLDLDDCRFARDARHERKILSAPNQRQLGRLYAATTARLVRKRLFREAIELAPPSLYMPAAGRLVIRGMLPNAVLEYIRRLRALR